MEDALEVYELKMLFYRAFLAFVGVKK